MSYRESTNLSIRSSGTWPVSEPSTSNPPISSPFPSTAARPSTPTSSTETEPLLSHASSVMPALAPGEQIWSTSHTSGGHRTEAKTARGVLRPRASERDQANWRSVVQSKIGYKFHNGDLLEEALESPGSGVTCVGESHRHFLDGNAALARVGMSVMKLVLREQCYLFNIPDGDADRIIDHMISRTSLNTLGINTKLQQYIRPRLGVRPSQKRSVLALLKDDFKRAAAGADGSRQISNGIRAIVGAVHFDGGIESVKRLMVHFGLIIKVPQPKPKEVPDSEH